MGHLKGRPPKPLSLENEKDRWLQSLSENLWQVSRDLIGKSHSKGVILICLSAIEDSIKTHTVGDPRGYLYFLNGFFEQMN